MDDIEWFFSGRCRAVLFDYFGTLTTAVARSYRHAQMARRLGVPADAWIEALDRTFYQRASGRCGQPASVLGDLARELGGQPDLATIDAVYLARVEALAAEGRPRPEAIDTLAAVRRSGLRTAVVSDCWYELPLTLPRSPLYSLLDTCVYSVEVGHCKPHPTMYLTACARLGVEPRQCLYIGDGGSDELAGAARLGMTVLRLAAPDLAGHLAFGKDTWSGPGVASLTELASLIRREPVPV